MDRLPRGFFDRDAEVVARELLGHWLVLRRDESETIGRVVETEAYLGPHDLASHSARGRTARTEVMFGPPGHAYVYLIYGMHHCLNVVTGREGVGAAVLLRALEPVRNLATSASGPGRLCKALGLDRTWNGHDLVEGELFLARPTVFSEVTVQEGPRVGVGYAGDWAARPLRFWIEGNPHVSRARA